MAHIGEIIRQWREGGDEPMTRDTVAVRTGRCVSTIRNWETGRDPRISDIVDLDVAKPGLVRLVFNAALAHKLHRPEHPPQRKRRRKQSRHTNGVAKR